MLPMTYLTEVPMKSCVNKTKTEAVVPVPALATTPAAPALKAKKGGGKQLALLMKRWPRTNRRWAR